MKSRRRDKRKARKIKTTMREAYLQPDPYVSGVRAEVWDNIKTMKMEPPQ
jgi:hypothetical protein